MFGLSASQELEKTRCANFLVLNSSWNLASIGNHVLEFFPNLR